MLLVDLCFFVYPSKLAVGQAAESLTCDPVSLNDPLWHDHEVAGDYITFFIGMLWREVQ